MGQFLLPDDGIHSDGRDLETVEAEYAAGGESFRVVVSLLLVVVLTMFAVRQAISVHAFGSQYCSSLTGKTRLK